MAAFNRVRDPRRFWLKGLVAGSAALMLAACGGGGGTTTPTPTPTPTPPPTTGEFSVSGALASVYENGYPATVLTGTTGAGVAVSQTLVLTPAPDAAYNGVTYHTAVKEVTSVLNGIEVTYEKRTLYFNSSPFEFTHAEVNELTSLGTPVSLTGVRSEVSVASALPTNADIGDEGAFYSTVTYDGSNAVTSTSSVRWSLVQDTSAGATADTAYLCLNITTTDRVNGVAQPAVSGKDCYRITKTGTFLDLRIELNVDGEAVALTP